MQWLTYYKRSLQLDPSNIVLLHIESLIHLHKIHLFQLLNDKMLHKRATPKWVTKSCDNRCDEVCGWNSIQDMANCLVFFILFFSKIWAWPVTFINNWIIECAWLGCTKYEVYRWNSIQDIARFFFTLIFALDIRLRSSSLRSLNAPYLVVPWYQILSL